MSRVLVGIGSNIDPQKNLQAAFDALAAEFNSLELSPVYRCRAVGFDGDDFYNLVASFDTRLGVGELQQALKRIEASTGRTGNETKWSGRTLDIDILTYDSVVGTVDGVELPRDEIVKHAYVLKPLADLVPEGLHPECGKKYRALWEEFGGEKYLEQIVFQWGDRCW
ncbi:2-amino-4-hydroxy-6-hydroxymethyldihydropteridine diphosphokinase [Hahella sp. CCB-MM4]|uniref:2-amino-4-hydroxy-6- hydroxymethyldihydropteridine diphosphokinase n=1 Tax=Hahella sp. (strain CCB-MM4) TaxID=1926491 RepID=UPI000B9C10B5|nr:2-amino-4-hydroxy-6-hydroxymethyldihydropteridine diphosphokinase [Hahella sp. CCB-MM4]OZG70058.1 2-amino-4-hydroxy-6-hydroxymethyldihydropteridine diphosphokinase [Hahella sp. CCB-MM4]